MVDEQIFDWGVWNAFENVSSCGVDYFIFLFYSESNLLLGCLLELLLNLDSATFDDVGVIANHVEGEIELSTGWTKVLVSDNELWVQRNRSVFKWTGDVSEHLV